jgi:hypothetical protein
MSPAELGEWEVSGGGVYIAAVEFGISREGKAVMRRARLGGGIDIKDLTGNF